MSDLFDLREDEPPAHLSELELDRMLAGAEPAAPVAARLAACEHCQERLAELRAEQEAFLADRPPHTSAALIAAAATAAAPTPSWWQRLLTWRVMAPASALAAAAVVVLALRTGGGDPSGGDVVRLKGGEAFAVLVRGTAGTFARLDSGQRVGAGTTLGFQVRCTDRCELAIVGISEQGEGYVVDRPPAPAAGPAVTLGFTVELDDSPGAERFYALFCAAPPDAESAAQKLEQLHPRSPSGSRSLEVEAELVVPGCSSKSQLVERPE